VQRFYLNLRRGETLVAPDHEGAEFSSIEDAFLEVFRGARELWPEFLRNRRDPRQYAYQIADVDGAVLMEVPLVEILESCRPVRPAAATEPPKPKNAVLNKRNVSSAVENACKVNLQLAELAAGLRAARDSVTELRESTQSTLNRIGDPFIGL